MKLLRWLGAALLVLVILAGSAWAFGALYYDGPSKLLAAVQVMAILAVFVQVRPYRRKFGIFGIWFAIVLAWWLMLKPAADGRWQPDVARTAWAEIHGDEVTIHNVRNFDYRTETDFTPRWETRKVRLSQLTGIDMFINYWGSPWMAHPIVSFQFADSAPVCVCPAWARCKWGSSPLWKYQNMKMKKPPPEAKRGRATDRVKEGYGKTAS